MSELVVLTPEQRAARKAAIREAWGKSEPMAAASEEEQGNGGGNAGPIADGGAPGIGAADAAAAAGGEAGAQTAAGTEDLAALTVKELLARARAARVKGAGSLNKDGLVAALTGPTSSASEE